MKDIEYIIKPSKFRLTMLIISVATKDVSLLPKQSCYSIKFKNGKWLHIYAHNDKDFYKKLQNIKAKSK